MVAKKEEITKDLLNEIFSYNQDTGELLWKVNRGSNKTKGRAVGSIDKKTGYRLTAINNKTYYVHRLIWTLHYGDTADNIDHINSIRSDNRLSNLRSVSKLTNNENRRYPGRRNTSGYLGVYYNSKRKVYIANICIQKKNIYLGSFDTPEKAHEKYLESKRIFHGGCTL